jgi:hypothetical protein
VEEQQTKQATEVPSLSRQHRIHQITLGSGEVIKSAKYSTLELVIMIPSFRSTCLGRHQFQSVLEMFATSHELKLASLQ